MKKNNVMLSIKQKNEEEIGIDKPMKSHKIYKTTDYSFTLPNPFGEQSIEINYYYKARMNELYTIPLNISTQYKVNIDETTTFYIKVLRENSLIIVSTEQINNKSNDLISIGTIGIDWGMKLKLQTITIKTELLKNIIPFFSDITRQRNKYKIAFIINNLTLFNNEKKELITTSKSFQFDINLNKLTISKVVIKPPNISIQISKKDLEKVMQLLPQSSKSSSSQLTKSMKIFPFTIDGFTLDFSLIDYSLLSNIHLLFSLVSFPSFTLNQLTHSLFSVYKSQIIKQIFSVVTKVLIDNFPIEFLYRFFQALFPM